MRNGSLINDVKYTKEVVKIVIKRHDGEAVQLFPDLVTCSDGFWRQMYIKCPYPAISSLQNSFYLFLILKRYDRYE